MDKVRAWLQDSKNLPIVAAGTGILIIVVALMFLKLYGVIGGTPPAESDMEMAQQSSPQQMGSPEPLPPGMGTPSESTQTAPGAPQPSPAPAETTTATVAEAKQPPMLPYRKDPFMPFTGPPTRTQALMALVPTVQRIRIAPAEVRPIQPKKVEEEAEEVLPPQPFRRVAGILWNGKVKAILETEGEVQIVQPGDVVTKGGSKVRVESIEPDGVVLKTLDTRVPMAIKVQLAGSIAARQSGGTGQSGGGAPPTTYREAPPPGGGAFYEGPPPGF
ncbi:MAG: hypothetical protein K6T99_02120 [Armatimonadetes bacterium]|nr:hypothetical protein [Armatimonadota bacterium]